MRSLLPQFPCSPSGAVQAVGMLLGLVELKTHEGAIKHCIVPALRRAVSLGARQRLHLHWPVWPHCRTKT